MRIKDSLKMSSNRIKLKKRPKLTTTEESRDSRSVTKSCTSSGSASSRNINAIFNLSYWGELEILHRPRPPIIRSLSVPRFRNLNDTSKKYYYSKDSSKNMHWLQNKCHIQKGTHVKERSSNDIVSSKADEPTSLSDKHMVNEVQAVDTSEASRVKTEKSINNLNFEMSTCSRADKFENGAIGFTPTAKFNIKDITELSSESSGDKQIYLVRSLSLSSVDEFLSLSQIGSLSSYRSNCMPQMEFSYKSSENLYREEPGHRNTSSNEDLAPTLDEWTLDPLSDNYSNNNNLCPGCVNPELRGLENMKGENRMQLTSMNTATYLCENLFSNDDPRSNKLNPDGLNHGKCQLLLKNIDGENETESATCLKENILEDLSCQHSNSTKKELEGCTLDKPFSNNGLKTNKSGVDNMNHGKCELQLENIDGGNAAESVNLNNATYLPENGCKKLLTDEDYDEFFHAIIDSGDIPYFLRSTYLNRDINRICIDVTIDKLKAEECMKHFSPKLFSDGLVEIQTIGDLQFGGLEKLNEAAGCTYNEQNIIFKSNPGQKLHNIQAGKCISTVNAPIVKDVRCGKIQFDKTLEQNKSTKFAGTLGAIMKDSTSGQLYGITAQHFFNSKSGYQKGSTYTVCDVYKSESDMDPVPVQRCLSKHHEGLYGHYNKLDKVNHCAVDIAAFPLFDDLEKSEIYPYFDDPDGPVEKMQVFRGCSGDMKGQLVQHKGAKSGEVKGEIIVEKMDVYFEGQFIGSDCFKVASDTEIFAVIGDSGSFITNDLSHSRQGIAYGVLSFVETRSPSSPISVDHKLYHVIAWCTRLHYGIDMLEKEGHLRLKFVSSINNHLQLDKNETKLDSCEESQTKMNDKDATNGDAQYHIKEISHKTEATSTSKELYNQKKRRSKYLDPTTGNYFAAGQTINAVGSHESYRSVSLQCEDPRTQNMRRTKSAPSFQSYVNLEYTVQNP